MVARTLAANLAGNLAGRPRPRRGCQRPHHGGPGCQKRCQGGCQGGCQNPCRGPCRLDLIPPGLPETLPETLPGCLPGGHGPACRTGPSRQKRPPGGHRPATYTTRTDRTAHARMHTSRHPVTVRPAAARPRSPGHPDYADTRPFLDVGLGREVTCRLDAANQVGAVPSPDTTPAWASAAPTTSPTWVNGLPRTQRAATSRRTPLGAIDRRPSGLPVVGQKPFSGTSSAPVDVSAVIDAHHAYDLRGVVDPVDDAVVATPRGVESG